MSKLLYGAAMSLDGFIAGVVSYLVALTVLRQRERNGGRP